MDDWQIGDLALCIDAGPMKIIGGLNETSEEAVRNLRVGAIYQVDIIKRGCTVDCIGIAERARRAGGVSTRFVKIQPLTDEERDSFLADLDEPITPARRVAPVDAALNARVGQPLPASALLATLPGPSADDTPCHVDGSGLSLNDQRVAHGHADTSQVQHNHGF